RVATCGDRTLQSCYSGKYHLIAGDKAPLVGHKIPHFPKIPKIPAFPTFPAFPKNFIHPINTETIVINKTNCQPIVIHCLTKKNPVADLHDEKIFFARNLPRIDGCIDFFCTFTQILNAILKR
ncbi:MAG: hypothetical protein II087_05300, partial [Muribaculaceae bacterium]|nr:hypothetical protein [Muribaculaceae bacterium]